MSPHPPQAIVDWLNDHFAARPDVIRQWFLDGWIDATARDALLHVALMQGAAGGKAN